MNLSSPSAAVLLRAIKQLHLPFSYIYAFQEPMFALLEMDGDEDEIVQVWVHR
jgi:hypothetical protein